MAATVIHPDLLARLLAEAAATPDREICGLLFGSREHVTAAEPTRNVAADPSRHFEVDPAALFRAHKAARDGGQALIGHYHSHPSGSAEPSGQDLADSEPGKLWLILADGAARLWLSRVNGFGERSLRLL